VRAKSGVRGIFALLGAFGLLCTAFGLVTTLLTAWGEHREAQWPQVTAQVVRCAVDPYVPSTGNTDRRSVNLIRCRLKYPVAGTIVTSQVLSGTVPASGWPDPSPKTARMQAWVANHPAGSQMLVHYNPQLPSKAVPVDTDMPFGGPKTTQNWKTTACVAAVAAVLLGIGFSGRGEIV
jgi:hypothetical protein